MLKKRHLEFSRLSMKAGLIAGMITVLLQLASADSTSRGVAKHQPAKLAAMEGVYHTEPSTPMTLIGYVDDAKQVVKGIQVPGLLSFLTYHNFKQPVAGLDQTPREDWPHTQWVFQTYHLMIYMWFGMFFTLILGCYYFKKGRLEQNRWLLWITVFSIGFPHVANQVGWMVAEMGRQPWVVYNILRTKDGLSTNINAAQVTGSITMFTVIFILLFVLFIYLLNYKIQHGPDDHTKDIEPIYSDRSL